MDLSFSYNTYRKDEGYDVRKYLFIVIREQALRLIPGIGNIYKMNSEIQNFYPLMRLWV